ncbi:single-stranded DNA-binding protein WHY2, mitochondrial isoform X2 [Citrus sinensis]|uniref:single-stranded DNA-binding protein WHY2, mitochondrial isoform X2 n=1 Tax=Citrus sinensis TaxID=2711 RepID=UPI002278C5F1|nr:single-stranded DNA-binding protein WHY2, mitochondrial isoform X2 [Citrus sinensis]
MMKLSRSLLSSRSQLSEKLLAGEANYVRDGLTSHVLISQAGMSTTGHDVSAKGSLGGRIFAPYYVYKGKAAFSVDPVLPTFMKLDSGDLKVKRKGVILLTFAPAIGERKYDWAKKQHFALSPTEVGSLLTMGPRDSSEFFHDPAMLSSNAGQMRKSLSIKANADGFFISLNVANNILKTNERFVVPVSTAEFAVMKTACSVCTNEIASRSQLGSPAVICCSQVTSVLGDSRSKSITEK